MKQEKLIHFRTVILWNYKNFSKFHRWSIQVVWTHISLKLSSILKQKTNKSTLFTGLMFLWLFSHDPRDSKQTLKYNFSVIFTLNLKRNNMTSHYKCFTYKPKTKCDNISSLSCIKVSCMKNEACARSNINKNQV